MPSVINHWSHDINRFDPKACRELASGEAIKNLIKVLPMVEKMDPLANANAAPGKAAAIALRRALRQGVPQMIVSEALQICRIVRNEIAHGSRLSTRGPDRELMIGTLPIVRQAAELAVRLATQKS
jgi:hypothetical protein